MSSSGRKIVNVMILVALVAYTIVAVRYCSSREAELRCTGLDIIITDSAEFRFVTTEIVQRWLADSPIRTVGAPLRDVDVYEVEQLIECHDFVAVAEAYTTIDGMLYITLSQRNPVLRVVTELGHNFYLDSAMILLPPHNDYIADVVVVSGDLPFKSLPIDYFGHLDEKKFNKERELLYNLINFVNRVNSDRFLSTLIAQIYLDQNEMWLLPRIGAQIIRFGEIADSSITSRRLRKLSRFYRSSFSEGWWRTATMVDVRFEGQVVCKNAKELNRNKVGAQSREADKVGL